MRGLEEDLRKLEQIDPDVAAAARSYDAMVDQLTHREDHVITANLQVSDVRTCQGCGCTDDRACTPPCWWVDAELCSTCATARQRRDLRVAALREVARELVAEAALTKHQPGDRIRRSTLNAAALRLRRRAKRIAAGEDPS